VRATPAAAGKTRVRGVVLHELAEVADLRGNLVAGEIGKFLPFEPKRFFVVHGVASRQIRGQHAHRKCHQFLVCVRGSCRVIADDGKRRQEFALDTPARGVYLPPLTWGVQYDYSADAALLVLASHPYDPADYVRDYDDFLRLVRR
jgi:dTDP-4-dehydrorhamnose 3,5-epimerase-like enzyme